MKRLFASNVPPGNSRLVLQPSRKPVPPWIPLVGMLVLAMCLLAYGIFAATKTASPGSTPSAVSAPPQTSVANAPISRTVPVTTTTGPSSTPQPQSASACSGHTPETRYVTDRNGAYLFDSVAADGAALILIPFRGSVQVYGTVEGRQSSNSNLWWVVRFGERCGYVWADPAQSRLSTTRPR